MARASHSPQRHHSRQPYGLLARRPPDTKAHTVTTHANQDTPQDGHRSNATPSAAHCAIATHTEGQPHIARRHSLAQRTRQEPSTSPTTTSAAHRSTARTAQTRAHIECAHTPAPHDPTAHTGHSPPSAQQQARSRAREQEQRPPSTSTNRDHVTSPAACRSTARAYTQRPRATGVHVRSLTTSGAGTGPAAARCITSGNAYSHDCRRTSTASEHHPYVPCGVAPRS